MNLTQHAANDTGMAVNFNDSTTNRARIGFKAFLFLSAVISLNDNKNRYIKELGGKDLI